MSRSTFRISSFLMLLSSIAAIGQPIPVKSGAPFVAIHTRQLTNSSDPNLIIGRVARSSNGSTYEEVNTKGTSLVTIMDVPHQRMILLYPDRHEYHVSSSPNLKAVPLMQDDPESYAHSLSAIPLRRTNDNGDVTALTGRKKIEGLDVFGSTITFADGRVYESWYCPTLDLYLETKMQVHGNGPDTEGSITHIRSEEPDPKLFEIPADYVLR